MVEQTPLEKILFGNREDVDRLLDACGIDRNAQWVKSLKIKYHDFGDGEGPMEMIRKTDLIEIMEHCQSIELKAKLRELLGAL